MFNIKFKNNNNNCGLYNELAYINIIKTFQRNKDSHIHKIENTADFNFKSHNGMLELIQENYIPKKDSKNKSNYIIFKTYKWLNNIKSKINYNNYVYSYYGECVIDLTNGKLIFFKLKHDANEIPTNKKNIKLYWGKFGQYYKIENGIATKRFTTIKTKNKEKILNDYICSITINLCNRFTNLQTKKHQIIHSFTQILENETNWKEIYLKDHYEYKEKYNNPINDIENFFFTSYTQFKHNKKIIEKYKGKLFYKIVDIPYNFKTKIFSTIDINFIEY